MKEFLKNYFSWTVQLNVLAIFLLAIGLLVGAYFYLAVYTNHGEKIKVPDLTNMNYNAAEQKLNELGLEMVVSDTLFLKNKPADIVLQQMPKAGSVVKTDRIIYVVINAGHSPHRAIPDVIDNCSAREAEAKLRTLGFHNIEIVEIPGEKEWVYAMKANGKFVVNGQMVSVDAKIEIQSGNGERDLGDSVTFTESEYYMDNSGYRNTQNYGGDKPRRFEKIEKKQVKTEDVNVEIPEINKNDLIDYNDIQQED